MLPLAGSEKGNMKELRAAASTFLSTTCARGLGRSREIAGR